MKIQTCMKIVMEAQDNEANFFDVAKLGTFPVREKLQPINLQ